MENRKSRVSVSIECHSLVMSIYMFLVCLRLAPRGGDLLDLNSHWIS